MELDLLCDTVVNLPSLPFEKRIVGNVPNQRMLEGVDFFVVVALESYQSRCSQPLESGFKAVAMLTPQRRREADAESCGQSPTRTARPPSHCRAAQAQHQEIVERRWHL